MNARSAGALLALPLALMLALSGCGGSDDDAGGVATAGGGTASGAAPSSSAAVSDEEQQLEFAQCMREQGVEFEDPGSGDVPRFGSDVDPQKVEAALEKCRDKLPNGGQGPQLDAQQIEQVRQLAKCMRENGVEDFPDPDANGRIPFDRGNVDPDDGAVQAATEKCRQYVPTMGGGNG